MKPISYDRARRKEAIREMVYRRRYLVPNLVTLGNMFCGYLAVIYAASDRIEKALVAIALALLLDGLDGRVARKLNATSKFGMEFDSFSDVISFGIAPAVLMYYWSFKPLADEFGVFITFVYLLCAASRLARFNLSSENLKSFTGLPTPAAAGTVIAVINYVPDAAVGMETLTLGAVLMLVLAYLMVSTIEFVSVKSFRLQRIGLFARICLGAAIALVWYNPKIGFFTLAMLYCASGPLGVSKRLSKRHT